MGKIAGFSDLSKALGFRGLKAMLSALGITDNYFTFNSARGHENQKKNKKRLERTREEKKVKELIFMFFDIPNTTLFALTSTLNPKEIEKTLPLSGFAKERFDIIVAGSGGDPADPYDGKVRESIFAAYPVEASAHRLIRAIPALTPSQKFQAWLDEEKKNFNHFREALKVVGDLSVADRKRLYGESGVDVFYSSYISFQNGMLEYLKKWRTLADWRFANMPHERRKSIADCILTWKEGVDKNA